MASVIILKMIYKNAGKSYCKLIQLGLKQPLRFQVTSSKTEHKHEKKKQIVEKYS